MEVVQDEEHPNVVSCVFFSPGDSFKVMIHSQEQSQGLTEPREIQQLLQGGSNPGY